MGCEKTTNDAIKIFYHFYYLMLKQIFRDFLPKFFAHCTSSMKITIRIPVADLSLDQACIYHIRAHRKIEYTAQNNTNFYTFISADIPGFLIFFLGQEIFIIIYRTCNSCLPFQLLEISTGRHSNCFSRSTSG